MDSNELYILGFAIVLIIIIIILIWLLHTTNQPLQKKRIVVRHIDKSKSYTLEECAIILDYIESQLIDIDNYPKEKKDASLEELKENLALNGIPDTIEEDIHEYLACIRNNLKNITKLNLVATEKLFGVSKDIVTFDEKYGLPTKEEEAPKDNTPHCSISKRLSARSDNNNTILKDEETLIRKVEMKNHRDDAEFHSTSHSIVGELQPMETRGGLIPSEKMVQFCDIDGLKDVRRRIKAATTDLHCRRSLCDDYDSLDS